MKGRQVLLDHIAGQEVAVSLIDGHLDDLLIETDSAPPPGSVYRAICDRPVKGQGGMFLRLSDGAQGFLRQGKGFRPGQPLLVQVTGYADDGKAIPVTSRFLLKSRYCIVTPGAPGVNVSRKIAVEERRASLRILGEDLMDGCMAGLILRSASATASDEDISEDIAATRALAEAVLSDEDGKEPELLVEGFAPHALAWSEWTAPAEIVTTPGCLEVHGVLDQMQALHDAKVSLGSGDMWVEATRAFVAVDVNTRGDTSPAAALKANLAAARQLPRTLRLRGLGGQIVVDFAPMSKAHRRQVEQSLRAAFKIDPVETSLVGWTSMGLFELQRKRERLPTVPLLKKVL